MEFELTNNCIIRIEKHVITQAVNDESILLNTKTEKFISLNDVGAVIWESLKATGDRDASMAAVRDAFETSASDDALGSDVDAFVQQLVDLGVAQVG